MPVIALRPFLSSAIGNMLYRKRKFSLNISNTKGGTLAVTREIDIQQAAYSESRWVDYRK